MRKVLHGDNAYLKNRLEQDHRGIKDRTSRCGGSSARTLPGRFVEDMTNFATSSGSVPSPISMFQPTIAGLAHVSHSAVQRRLTAKRSTDERACYLAVLAR